MQITYQLSPDDYRHALLAHRNRSFLSRWFMMLIALVFALWAGVQLSSNQSWMRRSLPATAIAIGICLYTQLGTPYFNARRQFRNTPSAQGQITLEVSDGGLHFRSATTDSSVAWSFYVKWIEDRSVFVLFSSPLTFVLVPKRAFNPDQLAHFNELLRKKLRA